MADARLKPRAAGTSSAELQLRVSDSYKFVGVPGCGSGGA